MGNGNDSNAFAPIGVRNGEHHGAWPVFCALVAAQGSLVAPEVRKPYDKTGLRVGNIDHDFSAASFRD